MAVLCMGIGIALLVKEQTSPNAAQTDNVVILDDFDNDLADDVENAEQEQQGQDITNKNNEEKEDLTEYTISTYYDD